MLKGLSFRKGENHCSCSAEDLAVTSVAVLALEHLFPSTSFADSLL